MIQWYEVAVLLRQIMEEDPTRSPAKGGKYPTTERKSLLFRLECIPQMVNVYEGVCVCVDVCS